MDTINNPAKRRLYLYSDLCGSLGWFKNPEDFRKAFPKAVRTALRCAHQGIDAPKGYHKPNGYLANDPILHHLGPDRLQGR